MSLFFVFLLFFFFFGGGGRPLSYYHSESRYCPILLNKWKTRACKTYNTRYFTIPFCIITWVHLRWRYFGSSSGWGCSQLRDFRSMIIWLQCKNCLKPVDLYSLCQPRSPLQHNLSSKLGMCTQLPQVHGAASSSTSPLPSSLLASSMSSYSKPDSVAIGSSRNGSRPSHSQGWSRKLSCNILRICKVQEQTIMEWNSVFVCSNTFPRAWSHIYAFYLHEKLGSIMIF